VHVRVCACAHKCVRPRACARGAVCVCDVAHVDIGKRAHACAPLHVRVCSVVCASARGDTRKASRKPHLTASPVYESSEGGEESAYDDRMSLEHLCATCRAARVHARRASDHSCEPAAASLASLAVLAPASHSAVGADGGAPAVLAHAPHSVMLADGGAPAVPAPAPPSVMLADGGAISLKLADMKSDAALHGFALTLHVRACSPGPCYLLHSRGFCFQRNDSRPAALVGELKRHSRCLGAHTLVTGCSAPGRPVWRHENGCSLIAKLASGKWGGRGRSMWELYQFVTRCVNLATSQ
jgi:hypothetical protein